MKTFRLIGTALIAIMMCANFASCSSDNEKEPTPPQSPIEDFNQTDMNFTEKAGEQAFSFTANSDWTVNVASTSGGSTWCTASPTQGNAGSQTIKITTTENDTYDDRSVTVTLKAGNESKSFVVILEDFYNLFINKRFERVAKTEVTNWQPCLFLRFAVSCCQSLSS